MSLEQAPAAGKILTAHDLRRLRYEEWLGLAGWKHFVPKELSNKAKNTKNRVRNETPPPEIWHRILRPMAVLDALREELDRPIHINSAYRSPAYDAAVYAPRKAVDGEHRRNCAVDFRAEGVSPEECAAILRRYRAQGMFAGGIGVYNSFTHLDTRGSNADWDRRSR